MRYTILERITRYCAISHKNKHERLAILSLQISRDMKGIAAGSLSSSGLLTHATGKQAEVRANFSVLFGMSGFRVELRASVVLFLQSPGSLQSPGTPKTPKVHLIKARSLQCGFWPRNSQILI